MCSYSFLYIYIYVYIYICVFEVRHRDWLCLRQATIGIAQLMSHGQACLCFCVTLHIDIHVYIYIRIWKLCTITKHLSLMYIKLKAISLNIYEINMFSRHKRSSHVTACDRPAQRRFKHACPTACTCTRTVTERMNEQLPECPTIFLLRLSIIYIYK